MPTVKLIYRKARPTGNFSIETSFDQMIKSFPENNHLSLEKYVSSFYSNGFLKRWKAIKEVETLEADIYHVTGDVHYLTLGLPRNRTILTIHDCGFMKNSNRLKRQILKTFWLDWPVKHCRKITAVSEATKQDIIRYTGCSSEKIIVIPTVIASHFSVVPQRLETKKTVILHIGLTPNKNFERHVEAIKGIDCCLHVIGKLEERHYQILDHFQVAYKNSCNISDAEIHQAYANCDLLLFASTFEGFGMPILEAQATGRPVVTSNISSMPEVAGTGACLVDPYDILSIRKGVQKIIKDESYRKDLIDAGFENIKRFRPEAIAQQYEAVYREILAIQ